MMNHRIRKHFLTLCLCFAAAALVLCSGCSEEKAAWSPGKPLAKDKVKIGVLYINKAEGCGYSYAHELGIRQMQKNLGLADTQIIRTLDISDSNPLLVENCIREFLAAGVNIIFATSWGYMDVCERLAVEFPHVVFAHASGYKYNSANFTNYFGRIYQARYLSGIVAGLKTRSGKIGYVAAMGVDNSEVTGGINAFAMGVESVNPEARVEVYVTNSWYAPSVERQAAETLIKSGCDVIAQHCDTEAPQLAAQDEGVWGIGYNTDLSREAPAAVLTSAVWNWDVFYTKLVTSVMDGSFTTTPYLGGMTDSMVGLSPLNEALVAPGTAEAVERARAAMLDGSLPVFAGPIRTNDGRTIGSEGVALPDNEILAGINWYYHTVQVVNAGQ